MENFITTITELMANLNDILEVAIPFTREIIRMTPTSIRVKVICKLVRLLFSLLPEEQRTKQFVINCLHTKLIVVKERK